MNAEWITNLLDWRFFGNTVQDYLIAVGVFTLIYVGAWVLKVLTAGRLKRLNERIPTAVGGACLQLLNHVGPLVYFLLALYLATRSLSVTPSVARIFQIAFVVILTYKVIQIAQGLISFLLNEWVARAEPDDPTAMAVVKNIMAIVRAALWAVGMVFVLDNLGIKITSVVAGLGIGGVAVALAAQAILGDAFSSFAIFVDQPFKVGDFVIIDDFLGTVEHVGFKTTRLRSLGGEQLVFSNTDLTRSRIRNYKRMETRRIVFKFGVVYQTSIAQLKAIPDYVRRIIEDHDLTRFDRAHFQSFGDSALIFEVVYYLLSPDYNQYMDVQQYINLRIMETFKEQGIEFAYPTQQLYVSQIEPPSEAHPVA